MFTKKLVRKSLRLACLLTFMGALTLGFSVPAMADAPAPDMARAKVYKKSRGINYPAYLYPRGQRCESIYHKYIKPARGYDFTVYPLASYYHVSNWE